MLMRALMELNIMELRRITFCSINCSRMLDLIYRRDMQHQPTAGTRHTYHRLVWYKVKALKFLIVLDPAFYLMVGSL